MTVIVSCGGQDPTATSAPAPAAEPTTAPAASVPATAAPAPTEAPQPTATLTSFRPTATPVGGVSVAATPTPAPTTAPAPVGQVKVQRVIAAMPVLPETNRIWAGPWNLLQQHVPFADTLPRNDPTTGAAGPGLAKSWSFSDDFTRWDFELREGVQLHFGNGEFTSADVAWVHSMLSSDDSVSTMSPVWRTVTVVPDGDYKVSFNFQDPFPRRVAPVLPDCRRPLHVE